MSDAPIDPFAELEFEAKRANLSPEEYGRRLQKEVARRRNIIAGTEQAEIHRGGHTRDGAAHRGIASPKPGALYALDPDMPPKVQRIVFQGEPGTWWLDGRRLGQGARLAWAPWPGRHQLELRLPGGRVDSVRFEVRGATPRDAVSSVPRQVPPQ